jgi:mRNA-degrading endonuclease RelE of RelBE toxin-antitoxin system
VHELPEKFWINADTGRIVPVERLHVTTIKSDPALFGYKAVGDVVDMNTAFNNGWVRADGTPDELSLETNNLRDASTVIATLLAQGQWYSDVFLDFDHSHPSIPDSVRLEGGEEIEAFAKSMRLPRTLDHRLIAKIPRRRSGPVASVISAMRTKVGVGVGDRMESFIDRARDKLLVESLRPDKAIIPFEGSTRIFLTKDASKFYTMQSGKYRRQIADHLRSLETNPFPPGSEKIHVVTSDGESVYRVRVGKSRIIYGVRGNAQNPEKILIHDIGLRKEIYRNQGV